MLRSFVSVFLIAIVAALLVSPIQAKNFRFRLPMSGNVEGVELEAGTYTLKLDEAGNPHHSARIVRNGKVLAESAVKLRPRNGEQVNTVLQDSEGNLREIRLKKQVIVFQAGN